MLKPGIALQIDDVLRYNPKTTPYTHTGSYNKHQAKTMTTTESTHFESLYPAGARSTEVAKILEFIKKGNSVQLCGLPGVGRSNLLRLLAYNNSVRVKHLGDNYKWFHFVYMDLSEVQERNLVDVLKFIMISLSYSLSERKMETEQKKVNEFLKEALSFQDELIFSQALKKAIDYLCVEKELTVIFLFDRFDAYIPHLTTDFFTNLKILRNRAKYRFSAIFSLERPLEDTLEPAIYRDFYEFIIGNVVFLPLYDPTTTDFRFAYLERASGEKTDAETKKEIIRLTGGHGKLSRIALESVLSEEKPPKNLESFLLSKSTIRGALLEIWNALTPAEQRDLLRLEDTEKESGLYLERVGLLKQNRIQIPLLKTGLENMPAPMSEKIELDSKTGEITQGNEPLTGKLSASEFKLLKFLIQNHDRVCEKEEIIQTVWSDIKTQEGVTDQALDQIVYRLRKKIETDPNNPLHVQTIKGRGYKFFH